VRLDQTHHLRPLRLVTSLHSFWHMLARSGHDVPTAFLVLLALAGCGEADAGAPDAGGRDEDGCHFVEPQATADSEPFETGLDLRSASVRICGTIHGGSAHPIGEGDLDGFEIAVDPGSQVVSRLEMPGAEQLSQVLLNRQIVPADGRQVSISEPDSPTSTISVHTFWGGEVPALPYTIDVETTEVACSSDDTATSYAEALDGMDSQANDGMKFGGVGIDQYFERVTGDPEPTVPLNVEAGGSLVIQGTFGDVDAATYGDGFLDRDAFVLRGGPALGEITVAVTGESVEFGLTEPIAPDVQTFPSDLFVSSQQLRMARIEPEKTYWLWIANRDAPAGSEYTISICGAPAP
jgi:hypothetical protein